MSDSASALAGLASSGSLSDISMLEMLTPKWAAIGTGLDPLNHKSAEMFGGPLPDSVNELVYPELPTLFGGYPYESGETAANAILIALFGVFLFIQLFIFLKNQSSGHKSWIPAALVCYCVFKMIGQGIRLKWATDVMNVPLAISSVVFIQTPIMALLAINFYFSTLVTTWRHPECGESVLQRGYNNIIYFLVVAMITMAIVGSSLPNLYFMTEKHFHMCQQVAQAASVLQIIYAVTSSLNVFNAYSIKPGKLGKKFFWGNDPNRDPSTYPKVIQPTWIESFSPFYFVKKGSQTQIYKEDGEVYRLFATSSTPAGGRINSLNDKPCGGSMGINVSIILITSIILLISSIFRSIGMFETGPTGGGDSSTPFKSFVFHNYIGFIFYGAFELLILLFWTLMRVDLRFYTPDRPKKTRPLGEFDLEQKKTVSHEESI